MRYLPILLLASIGAAACNPFGPSPEETITQACENLLKVRLEAPATYKRIKVSKIRQRPATLDQFLGWSVPTVKERAEKRIRRSAGMKKLQERAVKNFNARKWHNYQAFIDYTSSNSFGVPIKGLAQCNLVSSHGDIAKASKGGVKRLLNRVSVDGFSNIRWGVETLLRIGDRAR